MLVWRRPFGDLPDIKRLRACANKRPRTTTELFSCQGPFSRCPPWVKAEVERRPALVRSSPESRHSPTRRRCSFCAISGIRILREHSPIEHKGQPRRPRRSHYVGPIHTLHACCLRLVLPLPVRTQDSLRGVWLIPASAELSSARHHELLLTHFKSGTCYHETDIR
jgi:hypothetical protein